MAEGEAQQENDHPNRAQGKGQNAPENANKAVIGIQENHAQNHEEDRKPDPGDHLSGYKEP